MSVKRSSGNDLQFNNILEMRQPTELEDEKSNDADNKSNSKLSVEVGLSPTMNKDRSSIDNSPSFGEKTKD